MPTPLSIPAIERTSAARLSVVRSHEPIGKRHSLKDGEKLATESLSLSRGTVEVCEIRDVIALRDLVDCADGYTAVTYGVAVRGGDIVPQRLLQKCPNAIARDRQHFVFARQPGFLFLDFDASADSDLPAGENLLDWLGQIVPEIKLAPAMWRVSSSSYLRNSSTGQVLTNLRGQRLLIHVRDASDIPRVGGVLFDRLWLAGHGRVEISKSGRYLIRSPIDGCVWQPERLDYLRPHCDESVYQDAPQSLALNPDRPPLDTTAIADLSATERKQLESMRERICASHSEKARTLRDSWVEERVRSAMARGVPGDDARDCFSAATVSGQLFGSFPLVAEDGTEVTVFELLTDPQRWHGARFRDPLEPEYRSDSRIARADLLSGRPPSLYSHAHGGQRFRLFPQRTTIQLQAGALARNADKAVEALRRGEDFFEFGGKMVRLDGSRVSRLTATALADELSRRVQFERYSRHRKAFEPCNPPADLCEAILARTSSGRDLAHLSGVIDAPTVRSDGSVLDAPGYDQKTGLLLQSCGDGWGHIPRSPTLEQVADAVRVLWEPVRLFPFDGPVSRGVMLAAMLTVAARPALPTAPAFGLDSPSAGTGKTSLANVLAELAGQNPSVCPAPSSDEELRKSLFSRLSEAARVIVLDNVVAPLDGAKLPTLAAFITAANFSDRVLGQSSTLTIPNRAVLIATGNNLRIAQDLARRFMVARIDAASESPFTRTFEFSPEKLAREMRQEMIAAALIVVRGYIHHREPDNDFFGLPASGGSGSFEDWGRLVRQPVKWLAEGSWLRDRWPDSPGFDDPLASTLTNVAEEPHKAKLGAMLRAWLREFGTREVAAGDALAACRSGGGDFDESTTSLSSALREIASDRPLDSGGLGRWLRSHLGQVVDGMRFAKTQDKRRKISRWRVETVCSHQGQRTHR